MFKKIIIFLSLFTTSLASKINICDPDIKLVSNELSLSYHVCTFETGFSLTSSLKTEWLFLGVSFDDTKTGVTEGMYCDSQNRIGFYQISNGILGNKLNRYDFNELECKFDTNPQTLSVDRYMPNLWIKNTDITYFISSGTGPMNLLIKPPVPFTIKYEDNEERLVQLTTSAATKETISILFLLTVLSISFIF